MTIEKMRLRLEITPLEFTVGLIFGGLVISLFAIGVKSIPAMIMIVVAALELCTLMALRQPSLSASPAGGWLRAAALLTILTTALFLVPVILTGHVKSCFECENDTRESFNYFGIFALMWMVGLGALIGALISWGVSLVRLHGRAGVMHS